MDSPMDKTKPAPSLLEQAFSSIDQTHLLGQLLDGASSLVGIKDLNHRYLYANRQLETVYGVKRGELIGASSEAHVSFKYIAEIHARENSVIHRGVPAHFFERLVIHGRPHTWETIRFPFRDLSGSIAGSGFIAISIDEGAKLTSEQSEILSRANKQIASLDIDADPAGSSAVDLFQLRWHNHYESGNPTIDRQHVGLFEQANRLLNLALTEINAAEAKQLMGKLIADITQHFHDEESILRQSAYPHAEDHHDIHTHLLVRAATLYKQIEDNQLRLEDLFRFLTQDVISHHLLGEDRDYFAFIDRHFPIEP
jgi:hemerythrin-like metal-binding protein